MKVTSKIGSVAGESDPCDVVVTLTVTYALLRCLSQKCLLALIASFGRLSPATVIMKSSRKVRKPFITQNALIQMKSQ